MPKGEKWPNALSSALFMSFYQNTFRFTFTSSSPGMKTLLISIIHSWLIALLTKNEAKFKFLHISPLRPKNNEIQNLFNQYINWIKPYIESWLYFIYILHTFTHIGSYLVFESSLKWNYEMENLIFISFFLLTCHVSL